MKTEKQRTLLNYMYVYRDVVACGEKPVTDEVQTGYGGA